MAHKFELSRELRDRVAELTTDLRAELEVNREAYDEMSERWRDGDKGIAVDGWLDDLEGLVDDLEAMEGGSDA
jgi:hypothetical protein